MNAKNPLARRAALAVVTVAVAFALAACQSSSSKQAANPPTPPMPTPPPIQEAPAPYRAQLHAEIAAGYYERGQMEVALQELAEAAKLDPKNAKIYNVYGLVYAMLGENAKAEANFRSALELAPSDSEIRQNWGWFLCSHGKPREAIPEFEMAVRNPLYRTPGPRPRAAPSSPRCAARRRRDRGCRQSGPPPDRRRATPPWRPPRPPRAAPPRPRRSRHGCRRWRRGA